jgi:ABC-type glycerol-3-phosphate transport system substrate-binding protein
MRRIVSIVALLLFMVAMQAVAAPVPTIEHTHVFYFNDVSDYPDLKKQFMDEFSKKFNVNLVIHTFPRNTYMDNLNLAITSGDLKGIVLPFLPGNVLEYRDAGAIVPLDDFLKDNAVWKKLPDYFRNAGKLDDGKVWSIPSGWGIGSPYARIYRKDWADKLGFAKPETVDQLYAMCKAFTLNDPDGNGKQDTWGMTDAGDAWNLQDLFAAYDARTNNFGADCIVYDPNENAWIDTMLKPEMIDALTFINKIYKEGILDPESFVNTSSAMRTKMFSGKYGSVFYGYWWGYGQPAALLENLAKNAPEAKVDYILALKGKRTTNINQIVRGGGQHVMLASTPNPKEMINAFVNTFFGNEEAFLWGEFGIEGLTWKRSTSDWVTILKDPATGSAYPGPGETSGILPGWTGLKGIGVVDGDKAAIDTYLGMYKTWKTTIEDTLAKGLMYDASALKDVSLSPTYTKIINDVRKFWKELLAKVATGTVTPTDAVAQYRAFMKSIDGQKMLVETNQKMGLTLPSKYTY